MPLKRSFPRLRRWLMPVAVVAALVAVLSATPIAMRPAMAQMGFGPSPADCARTSGTSRMCVTNNSSYFIIGVEAGSFMSPDGHWIPIPGGWIAPGRTVMVNFPVWAHGTCVLNVFVETWDGRNHVFPGLNVCRTTRIIVGGWRY